MALPVSYSPDLDPHGRVNGYDFELDDGTSLYAFGPEADQLARQLDAVPDMRMAAAPPGGGMSYDPGQSSMADAPPAAPQETVRGPRVEDVVPPGQAAQERVRAAMAQSYGQPAPAAAQPWHQTPGGMPGSVDVTPRPSGVQQIKRGAVAAGAPTLGSQPDLPLLPKGGGAAAPGEQLSPDQFRAQVEAPVAGGYSPGVDPHKMAAQGVFVPQGRTITDALPYDEQGAEERSDAELGLRMARLNQVDFETARLAQEADALRAQRPELIERALEAKRISTERENIYTRDRSYLQDLIDQQRERKIDPGAFFAEKGTLGTIGIVLAQGLGAWGAIMGKAQNFAKEMVDAAIEGSVRQQEAALRNGQQDIHNVLGQLEREYGDIEQAKSALRLTLQDVADNKAREVAAQLGTHEAQLSLQQWLAEREKVRANEEANFRALAMGKRTTTEKLVQPVAPSYGGPRAPTLKEQAQRAGYLAQIGEAQGKATGQSAEIDPKQYQYASDRAKIEKAYNEADAFVKRLEAQQKTFGTPPGLGPGAESAPIKAGVWAGARMGSDIFKAAEQNRQDYASLKIAAQDAIPGVPSDKDAKLIDDSLAGMVAGGEQTLRRAKQMRDTLKNSITTIDAGAGGAARRKLETEKKRTRREAAPDPRPR